MSTERRREVEVVYDEPSTTDRWVRRQRVREIPFEEIDDVRKKERALVLRTDDVDDREIAPAPRFRERDDKRFDDGQIQISRRRTQEASESEDDDDDDDNQYIVRRRVVRQRRDEYGRFPPLPRPLRDDGYFRGPRRSVDDRRDRDDRDDRDDRALQAPAAAGAAAGAVAAYKAKSARDDESSDSESSYDRYRRRRNRRHGRAKSEQPGPRTKAPEDDAGYMWYSMKKRNEGNVLEKNFDSSYDGLLAAAAGAALGSITAARFGGPEHKTSKAIGAAVVGAATFNVAENWYRVYTDEKEIQREKRRA